MDVGTEADTAYTNSFQFGQNKDPFKEEIKLSIKTIEGLLQTLVSNTEDTTVFAPKEG